MSYIPRKITFTIEDLPNYQVKIDRNVEPDYEYEKDTVTAAIDIASRVSNFIEELQGQIDKEIKELEESRSILENMQPAGEC